MKKILIIDDDKKLSDLLKDYLKKYDLDPVSVDNPLDGISELDKNKYSGLLVMSASPEVKKYIKKIQDCVSVKPGKVSVKVEKITE